MVDAHHHDDDTADLLEELEVIHRQDAEVDRQKARLLRRRLAIFQQLRAKDPPVEFKVIGRHAGITDVGVMAALRKANAKLPVEPPKVATGT